MFSHISEKKTYSNIGSHLAYRNNERKYSVRLIVRMSCCFNRNPLVSSSIMPFSVMGIFLCTQNWAPMPGWSLVVGMSNGYIPKKWKWKISYLYFSGTWLVTKVKHLRITQKLSELHFFSILIGWNLNSFMLFFASAMKLRSIGLSQPFGLRSAEVWRHPLNFRIPGNCIYFLSPTFQDCLRPGAIR